jgi:hypothetical protein
MVDHMMGARNLVHQDALLDFALGLRDRWAGMGWRISRQVVARHCETRVTGIRFDSFEGLPEGGLIFRSEADFPCRAEVPHSRRSNIQTQRLV